MSTKMKFIATEDNKEQENFWCTQTLDPFVLCSSLQLRNNIKESFCLTTNVATSNCQLMVTNEPQLKGIINKTFYLFVTKKLFRHFIDLQLALYLKLQAIFHKVKMKNCLCCSVTCQQMLNLMLTKIYRLWLT